MMASDFEPAGELKFGQVGIANLRVRTLDVERLGAEMRERVQRAPKMFERAALVIDFGVTAPRLPRRRPRRHPSLPRRPLCRPRRPRDSRA